MLIVQEIHSLKLQKNVAPEKWMLGRPTAFPLGPAHLKVLCLLVSGMVINPVGVYIPYIPTIRTPF